MLPGKKWLVANDPWNSQNSEVILIYFPKNGYLSALSNAVFQFFFFFFAKYKDDICLIYLKRSRKVDIPFDT